MSTTSPLPLESVRDDDAWKDQVAARLAAHRQKKQRADQQQTLPMEGLPEPRPRQQRRVAEAVASRFAQQQSYRDYLQAEAEAAMQKARAEAEIAARNAAAIAQAQQQLLEELEQWDAPEEATGKTVSAEASAEIVEIPVLEPFTLEPLVTEHVTRAPLVKHPPVAHPPVVVEPEPELEPMVVEYVPEPSSEPIAPLSANLIEFPRQLVASKKARPRLAEGPLREDAPEPPQLRIFEVTAEQIATTPEPPHVTPEWSDIRLDAAPVAAPLLESIPASEISFALPPQVAPLQLRVMAGMVDSMAVLGSFAIFTIVFALTAKTVVLDRGLALWAIGVLLTLFIGYRLLFFSLSDQTPGMRYARIGLCTFSDENPSRRQMRRRLLAMALSMAPLGLGYLWALFDEDRMGWHDRISRMYMRAY
ncbi:RDD family protein [Terriglobus albidus]|uniref:RDD family protein n=1 Tax=Terriglobus albidus TaxID=1592106 RepID=UPI0021E01DAA|nr:RDD family protein [Terriglobus albidus]